MNTYSIKRVAPTVAAIQGVERPAAAMEPVIGEIAGDLRGAARVAVLAPDALGILPWRLWQDEMPFLESLHARRSLSLESIMPSKTPMNKKSAVLAALTLGAARLASAEMLHPWPREFWSTNRQFCMLVTPPDTDERAGNCRAVLYEVGGTNRTERWSRYLPNNLSPSCVFISDNAEFIQQHKDSAKTMLQHMGESSDRPAGAAPHNSAGSRR